MSTVKSRLLALVAASAALVNAQTYHLAEDFSGASFFSGFRYNESAIDSNNFGNVHFLSQSAAVAANLTFVDSSTGRAIIKVDNTTNGAGDTTFGRNTVYLISNNPLNIGSLLIFDANHIPYGCSVWPGFFTQGQNWPAQGEIDIVENVNLATINQYSLHVAGTCNWPSTASTLQSGKDSNTNCTVVPAQDINTGCIVQETKSGSFGQAFASNGGGVYAMQWNTQGISVWFFPRGQVPSDITATNNSPDPTGWGLPSAFYPASDCDPTANFGPQFITLYINLCGAFAGAVFDQTCSGVAPNCSAMVPDPTNYANAYWDINFLRTFSTDPSVTPASTSASPSQTGSSGSSNNSSGGGSGTPSSAMTSFGSAKDFLLVPIAALLFGLLTLV